jgi:pimeloyl-ACP methyl ester carboxylesterase
MTHRRNSLLGNWLCGIAGVLLGAVTVAADGPADNVPDNVRRIPKLGVEVPAADKDELEAGLKTLAEKLSKIGKSNLSPDVEIFHRAVDQALRYQEFFDAKEIPVAKILLAMGHERADQLLDGNSPWTKQTGLVVRGYRSKIDGTVQPYGLVIPDNYDFGGAPVRCDLWFHGRGETLSEVNFLQGRLTQKGEYTPANTIVLHPYGRYCNANKFAGEIDTFEALAHAQQNYRINPERIAVRGFSMGGAACWQFAVHYPGKWFAANPGAGFSETPDFLKVFQNETLQPTWYEQKLWRMYDCTGYAANLAFLPTVAYSGEIDKQKQAADMMEAALKTERLPLLHIIGPMTAHKIHPDSKIEVEKYLSRWERLGPPYLTEPPLPKDGEWETIDQFVTYTLRYNQSRYITIDAMEEHWEPARVVIQKSSQAAATEYRIVAFNVAGLTIRLPGDQSRRTARVTFIDGQDAAQQRLSFPPGQPGVFQKVGGRWTQRQGATAFEAGQPTLAKRHGLQGPIDDAFMDSFLFVKPTSKGVSEAVDKWVQGEFEHAVTHWRQHFRGDARVKLDTEVTAADMQSANVVLWGDPKSNDALAPTFKSLPITWDLAAGQLKAGDQTWDAATHLPLMIYPNPLSPGRYVVLNSSVTFREYDYLNNARQTPKLPDWAIVDIRTPSNSRFPGKVVAADFFNEAWQLKPTRAAK